MQKELNEAWKLIMSIEMKAAFFPVVLEIHKHLQIAEAQFNQMKADKEALLERMGSEDSPLKKG